MRQSGAFTAVPGTTAQVRLQYETGYVEIMNDSNQQLNVTMNTGNMTILPCVCYLMPIPLGGSTITFVVSPLSGGTYLNADNGPANSVIVNEYHEGEAVITGYPFMLNRSIAPQNNTITSMVSGSGGALSAGLTLTANVVANPNFLWFQGFDLDIDQESTTHQVLVTVTGLREGVPDAQGVFSPLTLHYLYRTQATGAIHDRVRFNDGAAICALNITTPIVLTIPAVSGGTAIVSANIYCTSM